MGPVPKDAVPVKQARAWVGPKDYWELMGEDEVLKNQVAPEPEQ